MVSKTGNEKIIEQLLADGITYMFGNPGTVEQGFLDALRFYPEMRYVLTLQESVAIMMADGYARATKRPALAQIHSTPGLGNAIGALYQAMRGHSPIVVIGGDAGLSYVNMEAQMFGDLAGMARPVTKWSVVVQSEKNVLRTLRRAVKIASTPPMGPVYVCLPADILDKMNDEPVFPSCRIDTGGSAPLEALRGAAEALCDAAEPCVFIGDGVAYADAQAEVTALAGFLGARVWDVDSGEMNMDTTYCGYQGQTGHMFGASSEKFTKRGDVILISGTYMLPEVYPLTEEIYRPDAVVIHIDLDCGAIAKNHRADLGLLGNPKSSLQTLLGLVQSMATPEQIARMSERRNRLQAEKKGKKADFSNRSQTLVAFMEALAEKAPDAVIFDEALTSSDILTHFFPPRRENSFFQTRGGSLGVGVPGAMAIQLAFPDQTVIGFTGDGGAMYTVQALWTAARYRIPAKFVVLSNRRYGLLQSNIDAYWKTQGIEPHDYPESFSLNNPALDFALMAKGQGVGAIRLDETKDAAAAVSAMLACDAPFLVDVVL